MVYYICGVGEGVGEDAVCLWLAFQTFSLHKITSWEDNLRACDNLFKLTFVQTVKASESVEGKCERPMSVSWFLLPRDNQSTLLATARRNTKRTSHSLQLFFYICHLSHYAFLLNLVLLITPLPAPPSTIPPLDWWGYHDVKQCSAFPFNSTTLQHFSCCLNNTHKAAR